jgi:hypothetical protein
LIFFFSSEEDIGAWRRREEEGREKEQVRTPKKDECVKKHGKKIKINATGNNNNRTAYQTQDAWRKPNIYENTEKNGKLRAAKFFADFSSSSTAVILSKKYTR